MPRLRFLLLGSIIALLVCPGMVRAEAVSVESAHVALRLELGEGGIALTGIRNKANNVEHLSRPSALFDFSARGIALTSNSGLAVDRFSKGSQDSLSVQAHAEDLPLRFSIDIALPANEAVALVRVQVTNSGDQHISLRMTAPSIRGIVTAGPAAERMGAVPHELGAVVPLEKTGPRSPLGNSSFDPPIGAQPNVRTGLPTGMNSMELASVFDAGGTGGVFFADVDGDLDNDIAPLHFTLSSFGVNANWAAEIEARESATLPRFAIGVHDKGDWHEAVDYYVKQHRPRWKFPQIPSWLRDQGAIYGFSGGGAGGIYLMYPTQSMVQRIKSFRELPQFLEEAKRLGTNIVYLWDYWESAPGVSWAYGNKGDYLPRSDLGGVAAFIEGVKAIQERGGKVIVYVEPFIIRYTSQIGREKGADWAGRDAAGELYTHYRNAYSMVAPHVPWQDYVVKVCERLVRDYGVDGIFLDSWAYQMNWPMQTREEGVLYSSKEYSQGVLTMTDRVRKAVQAIKPDAAVIGETTAGPIARHWHGGLSADFAWGAAENQNRLVASPVRYGIPEVNFISNGRTLGELNQVFAAGHALALSNAHLPWAAYIKSLVEIRQELGGALIHGKQPYQPATGSADATAYYYEGAAQQLITAVNISSQRHYTGNLTLREAEAGSHWRDLLSQETFGAANTALPLTIPPEGLRILIRQ